MTGSADSADSAGSTDSGVNPHLDSLADILRRPIFKNTCERLLLNFKQLLT